MPPCHRSLAASGGGSGGAAEGKRILFVIPWGERLILGTTDTDYQGDPDRVRTGASDIEYILGVVNAAFPGVRLTRSDLIASWAGVRPLLASGGDSASAPSDISRRHQISQPQPRWIDVSGGKLTTYRLMAEQTVDMVARALDLRLSQSCTSDSPLPASGGADANFAVLPPPFTREVVRHCCRSEWVEHLDDLLLRRTSWHFYHPDQIVLGRQALEWMAAELAWSPASRETEWQRYLASAEFTA